MLTKKKNKKFNMQWLTIQDYEECYNDANYIVMKLSNKDKIRNLESYKNTIIRNLLVNKKNNIINKDIKQMRYNYNELVLNKTYDTICIVDDNFEMIEKLKHCVNCLPHKQQTIIKTLLSTENITLARIAKNTKQKENTVKANYRCAINTLKKLMKEE